MDQKCPGPSVGRPPFCFSSVIRQFESTFFLTKNRRPIFFLFCFGGGLLHWARGKRIKSNQPPIKTQVSPVKSSPKDDVTANDLIFRLIFLDFYSSAAAGNLPAESGRRPQETERERGPTHVPPGPAGHAPRHVVLVGLRRGDPRVAGRTRQVCVGWGSAVPGRWPRPARGVGTTFQWRGDERGDRDSVPNECMDKSRWMRPRLVQP